MITYPVQIFDDTIDVNLHNHVYAYMQQQTWHVRWYDPPHSDYVPATNQYTHPPRQRPSTHRKPMAWNEISLSEQHPIVFELWENLNRVLDNQFIINGDAEWMSYSEKLPENERGWRVYANGFGREYEIRSKAIHRDSNHIDRDDLFTLVYFMNATWDPQFYGETVFYNEDPEKATGDYTRKYEKDQSREWPIGWAHTVVSPRPGRFMLYDSRALHSIRPCALYAPEHMQGMVFRLQRR
jgi:hypothetical protein